MKFVRRNMNLNKYIDNVFKISSAAKQDPNGINATVGCLCDEDGKLLTFNTVYGNEKNISFANNASYASPSGNNNYLDTIKDFVLEDRVKTPNRILATAGGTGGLFMSLKTCLDEKDTVIFPEIAWGNYAVIAQELNLNTVFYDIYDINSMLARIDEAKDKVVLVINSPCHNPCGLSYTYDEWKTIFDKLNNCGKEVVLLNDIAYIDYAYSDAKKYFELFNHLNDNVLVLIAYSCSKSFSYYGKRVGAFISINNDEEFLDTYLNYCTRVARSTWSNVNNGAMQNIADVLKNHFDEYIKEKQQAIDMIKKRSDLFVKQANECGLDIYPYTEGFFVTLRILDLEKRDLIHENLIKNHIYTIKVKKGIRIGLCSLSLKNTDGLAKRIKDIVDEY